MKSSEHQATLTVGKIEWAKVADQELERSKRLGREIKRDDGIIIPQFTTGANLRSWFKLQGEPATRLVETPAVVATRWMAFRDNPEQDICVFHEHEFGQAVFFFRESINQLCYIGVTYPDTSQGRTTPGSIWAGECNCAMYGGPCPPR